MTLSTSARQRPAFSPLDLQRRPLIWRIGAVFFGSLFLALSSYIEVPMIPVPVTMQTFAVALVGALYGWRLGGVTIAAWLLPDVVSAIVIAPVPASRSKPAAICSGDGGVQRRTGLRAACVSSRRRIGAR